MEGAALAVDPETTDAGVAVPAQPSVYDARGRHADSWSIIGWVAALIALTLILGWAILKIRRAMLPQKHARDTGGGLMEDLRRMLREGKLTQDEFDAARRKLSESMRADLLGDTRATTPRGTTLASASSTAAVRPAASLSGRRPGQRSAALKPDPSERVAPPGFDLTGAPLPPTPPTSEG